MKFRCFLESPSLLKERSPSLQVYGFNFLCRALASSSRLGSSSFNLSSRFIDMCLIVRTKMVSSTTSHMTQCFWTQYIINLEDIFRLVFKSPLFPARRENASSKACIYFIQSCRLTPFGQRIIIYILKVIQCSFSQEKFGHQVFVLPWDFKSAIKSPEKERVLP